MSKKRMKAKVLQNKMKKTIVVEVERIKKHPKYLKHFAVHKKYKVHDEKEECEPGDVVMIEESRPRGKNKKWTVVEKL